MSRKEYELSKKWPDYRLIAKINFSGCRVSRLLLLGKDYVIVSEKTLERERINNQLAWEFARFKDPRIEYSFICQTTFNDSIVYLTKNARYDVCCDVSFKSWFVSNLV